MEPPVADKIKKSSNYSENLLHKINQYVGQKLCFYLRLFNLNVAGLDALRLAVLLSVAGIPYNIFWFIL